MKTPKFLLLLSFLWITASLSAQVQWYQNQDGSNPPPSGTFSSSAKLFTPASFVACYQWNSNNEIYTWKISKSHINGNEQNSFFLTGTWASVEMKVGRYNTLYVLLRSFPLDGNSVFTLYKLDTNLVVRAQQQISLPNNFSIYNINAFELDRTDNIYLTGDGQYPVGAEFGEASFVLKTDKNLNMKWRLVDSIATSFAQLQIEPEGKVLVIEDFYTFFPQVKLRRYSSSGSLLNSRTIETDQGRFNLLSKLDRYGNLFLYGGKTVSDTSQAMFMYKVEKRSGAVSYSQTYFEALGIQLHDLKMDDDGRMFTLVSQYMSSGDQQCLVNRINPGSGNILWSKPFLYSVDSCMLTKLVLNESDELYVLGARRNSSYLTKGMVKRFKKNGFEDAGFNGPDSINYQLSHTLVEGVSDRSGQLIAIGNTNDFDPYTFNSTYFRAFAAKFGRSSHHYECDDKNTGIASAAMQEKSAAIKDELNIAEKIVVFPNPVQNQLNVSGINPEDYNSIAVFNMQGVQLLQHTISKGNMRLDVSTLANGVYLLVLRSSGSLKEKSIKFVVGK
jgi:Secretion system C-terminal sorting domain